MGLPSYSPEKQGKAKERIEDTKRVLDAAIPGFEQANRAFILASTKERQAWKRCKKPQSARTGIEQALKDAEELKKLSGQAQVELAKASEILQAAQLAWRDAVRHGESVGVKLKITIDRTK